MPLLPYVYIIAPFVLLSTIMVQPVGIEPTSTVLQTAAITISAKVANLGRMMGIEPTQRESQSLMLPLHHKLHKTGAPGET